MYSTRSLKNMNSTLYQERESLNTYEYFFENIFRLTQELGTYCFDETHFISNIAPELFKIDVIRIYT